MLIKPQTAVSLLNILLFSLHIEVRAEGKSILTLHTSQMIAWGQYFLIKE